MAPSLKDKSRGLPFKVGSKNCGLITLLINKSENLCYLLTIKLLINNRFCAVMHLNMSLHTTTKARVFNGRNTRELSFGNIRPHDAVRHIAVASNKKCNLRLTMAIARARHFAVNNYVSCNPMSPMLIR